MVRTAALHLAEHKVSVIPTKPDKSPSLSWKKYQSEPMLLEDVQNYFHDGLGLGVVCGRVSGNLELLDFDKPEAYREWLKMIGKGDEAIGLDQVSPLCYIAKTPGGWHVAYRRTSEPGGNTKLAMTKDGETMIETRGEGGYFIASPTKGYDQINGTPDIASLRPLSAKAVDTMHSAAKALSEVEPQQRSLSPGSSSKKSDSVLSHFSNEADYPELLKSKGWTFSHEGRDGASYWVRPGKKLGVGAVLSPNKEVLYIHTTSVEPPTGAHTPASFKAWYEHGGDMKALAETLEGPRPKAVVSTRGDEQFDDLGIVSLADFEREEARFLWEPYIREGQINLVDAKGGVGKTTFVLALAAMGSIGVLPFGEECEPFTTLYLGNEDTGGELRAVFEDSGMQGNVEMVKLKETPFRLDPKGMTWLRRAIESTGAKFVVFDAIKYYLAGVLKNQYDEMEVVPILNDLRNIAQDTSSAITNIRHFSKAGGKGDMESAGSGIEQWRNSHRSQLVMNSHPDKRNLVVITHEKGSIVSKKGEPFGFERRGPEMHFIPASEIDLSFLDGRANIQKEEGLTASRRVVQSAIREMLAKGETPAKEVYDVLGKVYSRSTIKRAASSMHDLQKSGATSNMTWSLDPFAED